MPRLYSPRLAYSQNAGSEGNLAAAFRDSDTSAFQSLVYMSISMYEAAAERLPGQFSVLARNLSTAFALSPFA